MQKARKKLCNKHEKGYICIFNIFVKKLSFVKILTEILTVDAKKLGKQRPRTAANQVLMNSQLRIRQAKKIATKFQLLIYGIHFSLKIFLTTNQCTS